MRTLVLFAATVVVATTVAIGSLSQPAIPQCAEDVVLVGIGSFDDGRYSAYQCGPAFDDYVGMD